MVTPKEAWIIIVEMVKIKIREKNFIIPNALYEVKKEYKADERQLSLDKEKDMKNEKTNIGESSEWSDKTEGWQKLGHWALSGNLVNQKLKLK